jgi:hypothetical protein
LGAPNLQTNDSKSVQLYYYDNASDTWIAVSPNNPMPTSATFSGSITIGTVGQGAPNTLANGWPVKITDGLNILGTLSNPVHVTNDTSSSGFAQLQVRDSSNNWTDVGYFTGDLSLPVALPPNASTESTLLGVKTQVDKLTFDSSGNLRVTGISSGGGGGSGSGFTVVNAITVGSFDLQASSFSATTPAQTNDYILDSVELNFSTPAPKTITISVSDGTILWGGTLDTSPSNLGYNTTETNFNLIFDQQAFSSSETITVTVTQAGSPCIMECYVRLINNSAGGSSGLALDSSVQEIVSQTNKLVFDSTSSLKVTTTNLISDVISSTGFDLQASSFSATTSISVGFILNSVQLLFSTSAVKTITITNVDGLVLWGGSLDTTPNNLGYNTTQKDFNIVFDQSFKGSDNITITVTQAGSPCLLTLKVVATLYN